MRLVPGMRERWQKLVSEFAKFGTIGVINLVVSYGVFNALVLTVFPDGQLKANVIATVVGTTGSYFMNRHWTFRDRPRSTLHREYVLFFAFNLAALLIELGVLALAKYGFGLTSLIALNIAKTFGLGIATIFRFWTYRTFVFPAGAPAVIPASLTGDEIVPASVAEDEIDEIDEVDAELAAEFEVSAELEAELVVAELTAELTTPPVTGRS